MKKFFLFTVLIAGPLAAMEQSASQNSAHSTISPDLALIRKTMKDLTTLYNSGDKAAVYELFNKAISGQDIAPDHLAALRAAGFVPSNSCQLPLQTRNAVRAIKIAADVTLPNQSRG